MGIKKQTRIATLKEMVFIKKKKKSNSDSNNNNSRTFLANLTNFYEIFMFIQYKTLSTLHAL